MLIWTFQFQRKSSRGFQFPVCFGVFGFFFKKIVVVFAKCKTLAPLILEILLLRVVQHRWCSSCELVAGRSKVQLCDRIYVYMVFCRQTLVFSAHALSWAVRTQALRLPPAQSTGRSLGCWQVIYCWHSQVVALVWGGRLGHCKFFLSWSMQKYKLWKTKVEEEYCYWELMSLLITAFELSTCLAVATCSCFLFV